MTTINKYVTKKEGSILTTKQKETSKRNLNFLQDQRGDFHLVKVFICTSLLNLLTALFNTFYLPIMSSLSGTTNIAHNCILSSFIYISITYFAIYCVHKSFFQLYFLANFSLMICPRSIYPIQYFILQTFYPIWN